MFFSAPLLLYLAWVVTLIIICAFAAYLIGGRG
jgi:hypothetical protein